MTLSLARSKNRYQYICVYTDRLVDTRLECDFSYMLQLYHVQYMMWRVFVLYIYYAEDIDTTNPLCNATLVIRTKELVL